MKKFDIGILINRIESGGTEKIFRWLLPLFCSQFKRILVVILSKEEKKTIYRFQRDFRNVELICLDLPQVEEPFFRLVYVCLSRYLKLRWVLRRYRVNLWISFEWRFGATEALVHKKEPVILYLHFGLDEKQSVFPVSLKTKLFLRWLARRVFHIVTCSKAIASHLILKYGIDERKITTIYAPVNFDRIRLKLQGNIVGYNFIFENSKVLLFVGRLVPIKGLFSLLRIFSEVKKKYSERVKLLILGDGILKHDLVKYANLLGLSVFSCWRNSAKDIMKEYDVYFLGYQDNPYYFMNKSSLFVFPSRGEGLPLVLVESLFCGCPVIASDCFTGPREILSNDTDEQNCFCNSCRDMEVARYGILMPPPKRDWDGKKSEIGELDNTEKKWVSAIIWALDNLDFLKEKCFDFVKHKNREFSKEIIFRDWKFFWIGCSLIGKNNVYEIYQ